VYTTAANCAGVPGLTSGNLACAGCASGDWPMKEKFLALKKPAGNNKQHFATVGEKGGLFAP